MRLVLALWLVCTAAQAGVNVSPVRVDFAPGARAATLTVSNEDDVEKIFQAQPMVWRQQGGEDDYQAAADLLVNPAMFRLAPGARQTLRIGFARPAAALEEERTWRVYLTELPLADERRSELKLLMRIGVPVFLATPSLAQDLRWERQADALWLHNQGRAHARLSEVAAQDERGALPGLPGFFYLLAGQSRRWPITAQGELRISASTEAGPTDVRLPAKP